MKKLLLFCVISCLPITLRSMEMTENGPSGFNDKMNYDLNNKKLYQDGVNITKKIGPCLCEDMVVLTVKKMLSIAQDEVVLFCDSSTKKDPKQE